MTGRLRIPVAALVLISIPLLLAAIEAMSYDVVNRNNGTLVSSGLTREYLLYVPRSSDRMNPTPLVISLHGAGMWPAAQVEISRWNALADREGFIVVYPSGLGGGGPRVWRVGGEGISRDVRFISDLIDTLTADYNIDRTRVYANGLSNGGGMSFVLSCALSDGIAAVGLVAAAHLVPASWCTDPEPVPMISFHGTADRFTPYNGGTSVVAPRPFPSIPAWTAEWAVRNRCVPSPIDTAVGADVTRLEYASCARDARVVLYTIRDGGHTWPGGGPLPEWFAGPTSDSIDATALMWAFFHQHRLLGR
ncbi:MAG TPA: PHB depolymerase family esterase [Vicinamibacterales bacterium]|nr:PHB depolymerase family esterase [Vicinamibacterales bacterium]